MPVVHDDQLTYEWDGEIIAGPVSTEEDFRGNLRPRWFEATLYRKADGTYVFHQVSYSRVWHLAGGEKHVKKPEWVSRGELSDDAVYCGELPARSGREQCRPVRGGGGWPRDDGREVLLEADQHKVISCPDHHAVRREAALARRANGSVSASVSDPMQELLDEAAENDPAFAGASTVVPM